jgi:DNA-binding MarR family transcriptional regulator
MTPADALTRIEKAASSLMRMATQSRLRSHFAAVTGLNIDRAGYLALAMLDERGPLRLSELAAKLCVDASTASRQIQHLERAGMIDRVADPHDGRATLLRMSAEGARALASLRQARHALYQRALSGWTATDQCALAELLTRLVDDLDAALPSTPTTSSIPERPTSPGPRARTP